MRRLERLDENDDGDDQQQHDEEDEDEYAKLCLLNDFSRRFYNLNLLMYTLDYQMSLFNRMLHTLNKINSTTTTITTSSTETTSGGDGHDDSVATAAVATSSSRLVTTIAAETRTMPSPPPVPGIEYDEQTFEVMEKLAHNIQHLKACISKKFEQFNSKLDGNKRFKSDFFLTKFDCL